MKISQEDVILIKNLYLSKQYGARVALEWIATQGLETVCWTEATRRVELSRNKAAVDRVRRLAVEDLVLQKESQKGIGQLVRFRMKLPFSIQVYTEK